MDMYLPDTVDSPTLIRRTTSRSDLPDARLAKLVDKFEGKMGTWENWFHKFQVTADMCRWSEASKLFMMTNALTGAALTAHRTMPDRVRRSYNSLVAALQERFGKADRVTKSMLRSELRCIRQLEGEDIGVFADRVYALTMDAHPPETDPALLQLYAVESFLQGCTDSKSAWLTSIAKNPTTISGAVNQMKLSQANSRHMHARNPAVRSMSYIDDEATEYIEDFSPEVRRAGAGTSNCFRCGGRGHFARDCPSESCLLSSGTGHNQSVCPAKASQEAHLQNRQLSHGNSTYDGSPSGTEDSVQLQGCSQKHKGGHGGERRGHPH